MADLTRLRASLTVSNSPVLALAGVVHHMCPDPTVNTLLDADAVESLVDWLGRAPLPFFGNFLSSCGLQPYDVQQLSRQLTPTDYANLASLANAMASSDGEWDRATRDDRSARVALHAHGAARVSAQSSVEFAALDLLSQLGFDGVNGAVAAFADVRRVHTNNVTRVVAHQFARSRHAVFSRIVLPSGDVRLVITPWCLSRTNALSVAAVMVNDLRRAIINDRMVRRAHTALTYESRLSLQHVRDMLGAATALLTRYTYNSERMAFVHPSTDEVVQTTATRQLSVAVAFAYVFTRGQSDALMALADLRAAAMDKLVDSAPPQVHEYFSDTGPPIDALSLFSRALLSTRLLRDATEESSSRSKGAMLGYLARSRNKGDRNTISCINRIEEVVSLLLARGHERSELLLVVEWGGSINHAAVLATAAVAGVDLALDVAASGLDLPGGDVLGDTQDKVHRYQLYLTSAQSRSLPRIPVCEYSQGEPLHSKLPKLVASVRGVFPVHKVAFIAGGVQHALSTPVSVCVDAVSRASALRDVEKETNLIYHSAEVLLPPACRHSLDIGVDEFLDCGTLVSEDCGQCEEHHRAVTVLNELVNLESTRLVKPRSIHGHNAFFSSETIVGTSVFRDTVRTLDAAISLSHARNCEFGEEGDPGLNNGPFDSARLSEMLRLAVTETHKALSGLVVDPINRSVAEQIAESIRGS